MKYTIETDADQEAGLTLARQQNADFADKTNQEYLDFVMGSAFESYIEQANQADFDKLREAYKMGDQSTIDAVRAAVPAADKAIQSSKTAAAEEAAVKA